MTDPETIPYLDFEVPILYYQRALDRSRMSGTHYLWTGAHCGEYRCPQIGVQARRSGKVIKKVISVAKLIFSADMGFCPRRLRRNTSICKEMLCVNPEHFTFTGGKKG